MDWQIFRGRLNLKCEANPEAPGLDYRVSGFANDTAHSCAIRNDAAARALNRSEPFVSEEGPSCIGYSLVSALVLRWINGLIRGCLGLFGVVWGAVACTQKKRLKIQSDTLYAKDTAAQLRTSLWKALQSSRLFRSTAPGFTEPSSGSPLASRMACRVASVWIYPRIVALFL